MKTPQEFPEKYARAVRQARVDDFANLFAEDVLIFDMWEDWSLRGKQACRKMAEDWFSSLGSEHVVVTFSEVQIVESGDLAFMTSFVRFAGHNAEGARLRFLDERMSVSLLRQDDGWKVLHQHTSTPIDSGAMTAKLLRGE